VHPPDQIACTLVCPNGHANRRFACPRLTAHRLMDEVIDVAIVPIYRDLRHMFESLPPGEAIWPAFAQQVYPLYRPYFDGLIQTYGDQLFGPSGLPGAIESLGPSLRGALAPATSYNMERAAERLLARAAALLPTPPPDLYLATLFFVAPAATLSVENHPAIAIGLERFQPNPVQQSEKVWYHPLELEEMVPHEAAHAARMSLLGLPPTPQRLSLLEMVMLEGTALTFTDALLGKRTLTTFMSPEQFNWHTVNDRGVRQAAAAQFSTSGMEIFGRYFSKDSPISGYYVGYSLCREYLKRYGEDRTPELVALPSAEILRRIAV
jgi:hypothetical protein